MSLSNFTIESKLGSGSYSTVYKVLNKRDNKYYAIKRVKLLELSEKERKNAMAEIQILASIRHPNIILYKEVFIDIETSALCLVLDCADDGELSEKIIKQQKMGGLLQEGYIWKIFIQIVQGLKCLHDLSIIHRDLKASNIFLSQNGKAVIGDMNVSKVFDSPMKTQTGTPYYASPEVWKEIEYTEKADIWSLGCLLYEMAALYPPFQAENMSDLSKKIIRGVYPNINEVYSNDLRQVIARLLQVVPEKRPSCGEILEMKHVIERMEKNNLFVLNETSRPVKEIIEFNEDLKIIASQLYHPDYSALKLKYINKEDFLTNNKKKHFELKLDLNNDKLPSITNWNKNNIDSSRNASSPRKPLKKDILFQPIQPLKKNNVIHQGKDNYGYDFLQKQIPMLMKEKLKRFSPHEQEILKSYLTPLKLPEITRQRLASPNKKKKEPKNRENLKELYKAYYVDKSVLE